MSTVFLDTSPDRQDDSSGGASANDFIARWNLDELTQPASSADQNACNITWQYGGTGAYAVHSVYFRPGAGSRTYDKGAILRLIGHILISRMPEAALSETCEALAETCDYYQKREKKLLVMKGVEARKLLRHPAVTSTTRVRPPLRIDERE